MSTSQPLIQTLPLADHLMVETTLTQHPDAGEDEPTQSLRIEDMDPDGHVARTWYFKTGATKARFHIVEEGEEATDGREGWVRSNGEPIDRDPEFGRYAHLILPT